MARPDPRRPPKAREAPFSSALSFAPITAEAEVRAKQIKELIIASASACLLLTNRFSQMTDVPNGADVG